MRHLVQFPEEIACILTEQEQQLYQRVGKNLPIIYGALNLHLRIKIVFIAKLPYSVCACAGFSFGLPLFPHSRPGQS